ncbi:MAG: hypothetical protein ABJO45_04730, partial [Lentilitoribacter sp.]
MANFVVTTNVDENDAGATVNASGGTGLSLREAIALANANADASIISFANGVGEAFENDALIRLTQGDLDITQALTIDGSTAGGEVVITGDANDDDTTIGMSDITDVAASFGGAAGAMDDQLDDNSRVINVLSDTATTLIGLTITGGRTTSFFDFGGGVYSNGDITLINTTVSGNSTTGTASFGGGVFGNGDITLINTTVSGNSTAGSNANGGGVSSGGIFNGSGGITLT